MNKAVQVAMMIKNNNKSKKIKMKMKNLKIFKNNRRIKMMIL